MVAGLKTLNFRVVCYVVTENQTGLCPLLQIFNNVVMFQSIFKRLSSEHMCEVITFSAYFTRRAKRTTELTEACGIGITAFTCFFLRVSLSSETNTA